MLPAAAAATPIKVRLPAPGQTAVAAAQLRFKGRGPRDLRLSFRNRARLGHSIRGLYAVYRKRRRHRTTITLFSVILRKQSEATASEIRDATLAILFSVGAAPDGFEEEDDFDRLLTEMEVKSWNRLLGRDAPAASPQKLNELFKEGGVDTSSQVQAGDLGDNVIDTGYYDDGHSFDWNSAGTKRAIGDWLHLTADNVAYEEVIERIEQDLGSDLNGNGAIGGGGTGGSVETTVGAPIITQP